MGRLFRFQADRKHHTKKTNKAQTIKGSQAGTLHVWFPCSISVRGGGCQWKGSDARTLNAGGTSLTLRKCRRAGRCWKSRNTYKNGKRNAIHIGGRAAFHNRCGLQHALFVFKSRKTQLILRKCCLQGRQYKTTQEEADDMDTR